MGLIGDLLNSRGGPPGDSPKAEARRDLAMFREAVFSRSDAEVPPSEAMYKRYGFLMYFLGAIRFVAVQRHLQEPDFVALAIDCLEGLGATHGEIQSAVEDIAYNRFKPRGEEAFREGAHTIEQWQMGKDIDAPMRYAELLRHW